MIHLSYLRFLRLKSALDSVSPFSKLDFFEEDLLYRIAILSCEGKQILVKDVVALDDIGSRLTIHRRMKRLITNGYIELLPDVVDGRKKYVTISEKSIHYFRVRSNLLQEAIYST